MSEGYTYSFQRNIQATSYKLEKKNKLLELLIKLLNLHAVRHIQQKYD